MAILHFSTRLQSRPAPYIIAPGGYTSDCWWWSGELGSGGHAVTNIGGRTVSAYRLMYERAKGLIPDGLELDHLCRNPSCINPDHLDPVTHGENMHRAWLARKRS